MEWKIKKVQLGRADGLKPVQSCTLSEAVDPCECDCAGVSQSSLSSEVNEDRDAAKTRQFEAESARSLGMMHYYSFHDTRTR